MQYKKNIRCDLVARISGSHSILNTTIIFRILFIKRTFRTIKKSTHFLLSRRGAEDTEGIRTPFCRTMR